MGDQRRARVVDPDPVQQLRRARACELLVEDRLLHRRRSATAVVARPREADVAGVVQPALPVTPGRRTPRRATRRRAGRARRAPAGWRRATRAGWHGSARPRASRRSPRRRLPPPARAMLHREAMRFGLVTPIVTGIPRTTPPGQEDAGPAELVEIAITADRLGYHRLTCSERVAIPAHVAPTSPGPATTTPLATLGFLAARTSRIRLVTHVLVLGYHHPLAIAKRFGTLDRLSAGRLVLGVGVGTLAEEFALLGAPVRGPRRALRGRAARPAGGLGPARSVLRRHALPLRRRARRSLRGAAVRSGSAAARRARCVARWCWVTAGIRSRLTSRSSAASSRERAPRARGGSARARSRWSSRSTCCSIRPTRRNASG